MVTYDKSKLMVADIGENATFSPYIATFARLGSKLDLKYEFVDGKLFYFTLTRYPTLK